MEIVDTIKHLQIFTNFSQNRLAFQGRGNRLGSVRPLELGVNAVQILGLDLGDAQDWDVPRKMARTNVEIQSRQIT